MNDLIKFFCLFLCICSPWHTSGQIINTVAGDGTSGYGGDGTPATTAKLKSPFGIHPDKNGNLYISDSYNQRVRKVDASGIIKAMAGTGAPGYSGDGIAATSSELSQPTGLTMDAVGNLYIADNNNGRVRKIDVTGIITTTAGTGSGFYVTDGVPATSANISPNDVAIDISGNIYVADPINHRIFKITSGIITTFAGTGTSGYTGDGLAATLAELSGPTGIALDDAGNLYIADWLNNSVRKVDISGVITTFAGTGVGGYSGDNVPASTAQLNQPQFVSADACGNIYISDGLNGRIRRVTRTGIITTIAGKGIGGYSGDGGPATNAK